MKTRDEQVGMEVTKEEKERVMAKRYLKYLTCWELRIKFQEAPALSPGVWMPLQQTNCDEEREYMVERLERKRNGSYAVERDAAT